MAKTRNIVLNDEIIEIAEREAERLGLSFSAFVRLLLSQYFDGIIFERKPESNPASKKSVRKDIG